MQKCVMLVLDHKFSDYRQCGFLASCIALSPNYHVLMFISLKVLSKMFETLREKRSKEAFSLNSVCVCMCVTVQETSLCILMFSKIGGNSGIQSSTELSELSVHPKTSLV